MCCDGREAGKEQDEMMITTVTLNPCIDLTVRIPDLRVGGLNLVSDTRTDVCGKGVNVSLVLREFGLATICTGISFDGNGQQLSDRLEQHSITGQFAVAHGNIRTNIKVFDEAKREMTELNNRGEPVEPIVVEQYLTQLLDCARRSEIVVFSGRIAQGSGDDIYRRSIKALKKLPVKIIVDAEGEPLKQALKEKPYLIKPNTYELETAFRCKIKSREDVVRVCREKVIAKGVQVVCVSMGGDGAMIVDRNEAFHAPALALDIKGFQGAGDSMVAGICKAMKERRGIDDMLRFGVAAASASLIREGTLLCRRQDFAALLPKVQVEKLDINPMPPEEPKKPRSPKKSNTQNKPNPEGSKRNQ